MIYKDIDGVRIPALGLGTFGLKEADGEKALSQAIEIGYRHIDTAVRYGNEAEIGRAIRNSGVARPELFITTKIPQTHMEPEAIGPCLSESLDRLQMDHVDLLLLHWPPAQGSLVEILAALEAEKRRGRARLIGVSNFTTSLLVEAVGIHGAHISVNQVEYHPFLQQDRLRAKMRELGMALTAYLPLAQGAVFAEPVLQGIGQRYGKSAGQVALRWLIQQPEVMAIPRSSRRENMRSNFEIFDFSLSDQEISTIASLARGLRLINPPFAPLWDPS